MYIDLQAEKPDCCFGRRCNIQNLRTRSLHSFMFVSNLMVLSRVSENLLSYLGTFAYSPTNSSPHLASQTLFLPTLPQYSFQTIPTKPTRVTSRTKFPIKLQEVICMTVEGVLVKTMLDYQFSSSMYVRSYLRGNPSMACDKVG